MTSFVYVFCFGYDVIPMSHFKRIGDESLDMTSSDSFLFFFVFGEDTARIWDGFQNGESYFEPNFSSGVI